MPNLMRDIKLNVEPTCGCQRPRDPTVLAGTVSTRKRLSPKANFPDAEEFAAGAHTPYDDLRPTSPYEA